MTRLRIAPAASPSEAHHGFKGTLTLEMINLGPASFMLRPGMAIAQLIVEEVKGCPIENPSQFQGQRNPAG
jgi:dCTP deaminase